ncbi:MAG TPA: rhamnulokinase family protein [Gaiellaceae bacterium]
MNSARSFAAVDLGAETGRIVVGRLRSARIELEIVGRFGNNPVRLPDGLHWNMLSVFSRTLDGLAAAAALGRLDGIGVDAWGCDYAALDDAGRVLGTPFHYRDARTSAMVERAYDRVSFRELYAVTGIQSMPINTLFQLLADQGSPIVDSMRRLALVPDLIALWLTGVLENEITAASTTGLLDARAGAWARQLAVRLGLPTAPFEGTLTEPGRLLGPVLTGHDGLAGIPVRTVAGHDTASAFAAVPISSPNAAIISSGTWSLVGMELAEPRLGDDAAEANLSNERGVDGTTRLLRNVMGLWLLQECRRQWSHAGQPSDYDELTHLAAAARPDVPLFDPDEPAFLSPGDVPARIAAACRASGQEGPRDRGETVRSIFISLACKYRFILELLERVSGRRVEVLHVVGGGARNELLCQLTADITGIPVIAGPVEAAALGNVLIQARAAGELASLAEMRELVSLSFDPRTYVPLDIDGGVAAYQRFLELLSSTRRAAAALA